MSQPAEAQSAGESLPEKPARAQSYEAPHATQPGAQPPQFQPLELPKVEPFSPSRTFSVGKLALACFNFVFAIIALGLSLGLVLWSIEFDSFIPDIIMAVVAGASIIWQLAEFLTLFIRRSISRPIHPGAHVGVHLVLWILSILVVISLAYSLFYTLNDWTVDPSCDGDDGDYWAGSSYVYCGWDNFSTLADATRYIRMVEALLAFSVLMTVAHFVLFVLACLETDRRRKYGKTARVVYLVPGPADGRLYYTQIAPGPQAVAGRRRSKLDPPQQPVRQGGAGGDTAPDAEMYGYYSPSAAAPAGQDTASSKAGPSHAA